MHRFVLALLLIPALAGAQEKSIPISTGVEDADLADTPATSAIHMEASQVTNQLSLTVAVTPGTTTVVDVWCEESVNGVNFDQIAVCDTASPSACSPDVRRFTLADYTAVSGVYYLAVRYAITKKWARCKADDAADGTGTVTITGARSWR